MEVRSAKTGDGLTRWSTISLCTALRIPIQHISSMMTDSTVCACVRKVGCKYSVYDDIKRQNAVVQLIRRSGQLSDTATGFPL